MSGADGDLWASGVLREADPDRSHSPPESDAQRQRRFYDGLFALGSEQLATAVVRRRRQSSGRRRMIG